MMISYFYFGSTVPPGFLANSQDDNLPLLRPKLGVSLPPPGSPWGLYRPARLPIRKMMDDLLLLLGVSFARLACKFAR